MVALAGALLLSVSGQNPGLAEFGLQSNRHIVAANGKAVIAEGETIELIGITDLADPLGQVWDVGGRLVDRSSAELFWKILDDRPPADSVEVLANRQGSQEYVRRQYGNDRDKRTVALAFRLSPNLNDVNDVRADVDKTFVRNVAATRPVQGSGESAYVGVARILKPILPKDSTETTFDFRLEVAGGTWTNIVEFPFGPDTKLLDGKIDAMMRYRDYADFREINGVREIVDYKGYYFTMTLPEALREVELEMVTNDPAEDAQRLPRVITQHIRGEDESKELAGKDLFLVYGLRKRSEGRKFTLKARPKRIVEFKAIPFVRN